MLIRIEAPYFVAGVDCVEKGRYRCAPIIKYMASWTIDSIIKYCKRKRWKYEIYK